jgi:hypothetical protein
MKSLGIVLMFFGCGCGIYRFNDASVDPDLKTFKVAYIENKARYVNPALSPKLTDKLRQKIIGQTRLKQNNDTPHLEIIATINEYSVSTSGVSGSTTASQNRLNVGLSVQIKNNLKPANSLEENISRSFDFSASRSLAEAEAGLTDEIIKNVVDEIFNKIFSKW